MKFLVDASLPHSVVAVLAEDGHEAIHVDDAGIGNASDDTIAEYARQKSFAIITADFDFADIRVFPPVSYNGIAVLTLPKRRDLLLIHLLVREVLQYLREAGSLTGKLLIVELGRIRVRD